MSYFLTKNAYKMFLQLEVHILYRNTYLILKNGDMRFAYNAKQQIALYYSYDLMGCCSGIVAAE